MCIDSHGEKEMYPNDKGRINEQSKEDKPGAARVTTGIPFPDCLPDTSVAPGLSELDGKMSNSLPWYPWFPNRWFGSLKAKKMNYEEKGIYRELLDWQWQGSGYLPSDMEELNEIVHVDLKKHPRVLSLFPVIDSERRANPVLLQIWEDQQVKHKRRSDSANKRWDKERSNKNINTYTHNIERDADAKIDALDNAMDDTIKQLTWKTSYEIYLDECTIAYEALSANTDWIKQQEKFHPNIDIPLSLEKAFTNFWGTEAGWKHKKKKARSKEINWKTTFTNAIDMNKVYKPRYGNNDAEKGRFTSV